MEMGAHGYGGPWRWGHTAATALSHAWGAVPQRYPARLSPGVKPPTHRKGQGWVPSRRAPGCPQGPCGSALAPGLHSEISLSAQNPQQRHLHGCPQGHPQPHCKLAAASLWLFGDRNSAAKKKNLTCAGKAPVPGSGKLKQDPLQQNHVLKKKKAWGWQTRGRGNPMGEDFRAQRGPPTQKAPG